MIARNRFDEFWAHQYKGFVYSEDFKDLINNMLQLDPKQRLSMADIIGHPWMQGEMATHEEIKLDFEDRLIEVNKKRQDEALKRKQERANNPQNKG